MTYGRGVQLLSEQIGVDPDHVARALHIATRTHAAVQAVRYGEMTAEQFRRLIVTDQHTFAIVGSLAMRFAGRIEDAHLLMAIYKASIGATVHHPVIRAGEGTLPDLHGHAHVQHAIRILQAAGLPPIHTDGTHELRPGFQVMPGCDDELPGWVLMHPDPDADYRPGFAGGRVGYLAVMRWAGWGVITEHLTGGLLAACHPDYRDNPFPR
ncbi:hypothetical protein [Streptomyces sp. Isolate_219]|uniref:hypothetical protein n=1 Tax=Streptomyces sp. Isolate_219 TaxID=2950110 RepID=UPI0021C76EA5|nr:hypothetical protein [Streptomyces sp. Isolate_219]MCR8573054.1 hypothetical protein [Streptomyces sp. Isolate_219]